MSPFRSSSPSCPTGTSKHGNYINQNDQETHLVFVFGIFRNESISRELFGFCFEGRAYDATAISFDAVRSLNYRGCLRSNIVEGDVRQVVEDSCHFFHVSQIGVAPLKLKI